MSPIIGIVASIVLLPAKPPDDTPGAEMLRQALNAFPPRPVKRIDARPVQPAVRRPGVRPVPRQLIVHVGGVNANKIVSLKIPDQPTSPGDEDENDEEEVAPPPVAGPLNLNEAVLDRENFDRWIYGNEASHEVRQRQLEEKLIKKLELTEQRMTLTKPQRAKLRLACLGDIKHFLDRVDTERQAFEESRKNFQRGLKALKGLAALEEEFQSGPFGAESLFAKTLRKIEDEKAR